jgi:hypothetical protein
LNQEVQDSLAADRPLPNEELNRAILADGIARLEKQLDAAEKRAREAEASAKEAKAALAEVLLDKARSQKSATVSGPGQTSQTALEVQSLRAELDAARRDIQQQESRIQDARDDAAEELRLEYERRFHAARERMAHEFQKRLNDAKSALALDTKRRAAGDSTDAPSDAGAKPEERPAVAPLFGLLGTRGLEGIRRHVFAIPIAAFAGGLLLGWSAMPGRSEPDVVAAKDVPLPTENAQPAPIPTMEAGSVKTAGPEKPIAMEPTEPPHTPSPMPPLAETPQPAAVSSTSAEPAANVDHPALRQEASPAPADDRHSLQERNLELSAELDALQRQLDAASKRAKAAETTLNAERKKAAELARRAAADERTREERARADEAAAANRLQRPTTSASEGGQPPVPFRLPYRIE